MILSNSFLFLFLFLHSCFHRYLVVANALYKQDATSHTKSCTFIHSVVRLNREMASVYTSFSYDNYLKYQKYQKYQKYLNIT